HLEPDKNTQTGDAPVAIGTHGQLPCITNGGSRNDTELHPAANSSVMLQVDRKNGLARRAFPCRRSGTSIPAANRLHTSRIHPPGHGSMHLKRSGHGW